MSSLQNELKKRRPFESIEQELALALIRTADWLQIRFERLFRQFGLTASQYNVLRILRGEGAPLPVLEIAGRTVTVVPGITGLVDRLESAGMVRRERCTKDRRVVYVALTDQGREVLGQLDGPLLELHQRLLRRVSKTQQRELIGLLEVVRASIAAVAD